MTRAVLLERKPHQWFCPNCTTIDTTFESRPHTRFHSCRGLKGMTSPMILEGTKVKIEAVEREDYVGDENVQLDGESRPIMAVITTRDEGQDCLVFAPTASGSPRGEMR